MIQDCSLLYKMNTLICFNVLIYIIMNLNIYFWDLCTHLKILCFHFLFMYAAELHVSCIKLKIKLKGGRFSEINVSCSFVDRVFIGRAVSLLRYLSKAIHLRYITGTTLKGLADLTNILTNINKGVTNIGLTVFHLEFSSALDHLSRKVFNINHSLFISQLDV